MTTKGYGPPLDALDAVCKAYKALGLIKLTIRIIFSSEFSDVNFKSFKRFLNPSQDCVNCVTDKFGDQCIGEIVSYDYKSWLR